MLYYKTKVRILEGFYKGSVGEVIQHSESYVTGPWYNKRIVNATYLVKINEDTYERYTYDHWGLCSDLQEEP